MAKRALALAALLAVGCGGTVSPSTNDAAVGDTSSADAAAGDTRTSSDTAAPIDTGVPPPVDVGPLPFDYCKELGNRASKCGDGFDPTGCAKQLACYDTIVRTEARDELLRCFATRDCAVSDDKCAAASAAKYTTDPVVSEYVKTCTEKRAACTGAFADDYCGFDHGLFTDEYRAKTRACLDQPCSAVAECFRTIFRAAGCGG
jgi:hypothetical protein